MRRLREALLLAATILTGPLSRLAVRPLGDEGRRSLPGDELEPDATGQWTNAITIRARPADIWPWVVQMGCRQAGWYGYDGLDNGGHPSAERIVPGLREIAVGDVFPWTPTDREGFVVRAVEPERALVLGGTPPPFRMTRAFVLEPVDEATTRLICACPRCAAERLDRAAVAARRPSAPLRHAARAAAHHQAPRGGERRLTEACADITLGRCLAPADGR